MSFLRTGGSTRIVKVGVTTLSLLAFQVLALIGAGSASAFQVTGCQYNAASDTVIVNLEPNDDITIEVADYTAPTGVSNEIVVVDNNTATERDCGSATTGNTTAINVLGTDVGSEIVEINNGRDGTFGDIAFTVDFGQQPALTTDDFYWTGSDGDDEVTVNGTQQNQTGTSNGGVFEVLGAEYQEYDLGDGDDSFDGDGSTARTVINGEGDDDFIKPGLGPDVVDGGVGGEDWVSYEDRTGNVSVSLNSNPAAPPAATDADDGERCTDDVTIYATATQGACEGDDVWGFEVVQTGSGNDYLEGDEFAVANEVFLGGLGDDFVDGGLDPVAPVTDLDTVAFADCDGPVTIDTATGVATGCGTDTWESNVEAVAGSPAGEGAFNTKTGEITGGDTLDFSGESGVTVDLVGGAVTGASSFEEINGDWDHFENVIGSPDDDTILGDPFRNVLLGEEGNDTLNGRSGNDLLGGGPGNDSFTGAAGADTVWFGAATEGVLVDLSLGFATGEGDDTFASIFSPIDVEIVFGSDFDDDITGGLTGFGSGVNFRFVGKAGNDLLTGADSNDTLLGGRGNDVMRGGPGQDLLKGFQGEDWGYGGSGADLCKKVEHRRSCTRV